MHACLAWMGAGALVGATLAGHGHLALQVVALACGSFVLLVGLKTDRAPRAWLGPASALLACLATASSFTPRTVVGTRCHLEGTVIAVEEGLATLSVDRATSIDGGIELNPGVVRVPVLHTEIGARLAFTATLASAPRFRNESPHPAWPSNARLVAREAMQEERTDEPERFTPRVLIARLRHHVRMRLRASLAPAVAHLVEALVLGDGPIEEGDAQAARLAGLTHVVAVSGMHVTLLVGALVMALNVALRRSTWLLRRTDTRRIAWTLGALIAPLYAVFAGGSSSAWRAAVTASITWVIAAMGRRADPLAVTGFVVVLGHLFAPESVRSPGFALSVVATAAVLDVHRSSDGGMGDVIDHLAEVKSLARASLRAALATAPVTLWCFGTLPVTGVLANLVVVPIVAAVLLPLGTVHALLASVSIDLAGLTRGLTEAVTNAFLTLSAFFAELGGRRTLPPPDTLQLASLTLFVVAILVTKKRATRFALIALSLLGIALGEVHLRHREHREDSLRITFADVGQGDAALIDMPDGALWMIDTGGVSFGVGQDPGEYALAPLLRARRRERIDVLMVSHPHPDHFGGVAALAQQFAIGEVWDTGQVLDESPDSGWARTLLGLPTTRRLPPDVCGHRAVHGVQIEVLSPCPRFDAGWDPNDNSFVFLMTYGAHRFLFTGDAEEGTEEALVRRGLSHVDVVKVGHHGSRTSSTQGFVDATSPVFAVISAGVANQFHHPHADVVSRWSQRSRVLRTDAEGSITMESDGEHLNVRTFESGAL